MSVSPARAAAFEILMRIEDTDAYASELLHAPRFEKLSPADHGLLTEIVMGVLRWRGALDEEIAERSSQRLPKLDTEVLTALRIGAYQLLFLDRVPRHAAVNESVELVKRAHKRSASGLVNAVLRKIDRVGGLSEKHEEGISHESARPPLSSFAPLDPSASLRAGSRGRPSPQVLCHPQWLVERWERNYGSEAARKICEYDQAGPKAVVHVENFRPREIAEISEPVTTFRESTDWEQLKSEAIQLQPGKLVGGAFTVTGGDITRSDLFRERRLFIQDEASQLVALLVGNGSLILDCCAAPGGKTRMLAERNPAAIVIAMELHPRRAGLLKKLVAAPNVHIVAADVRSMPTNADYDRVLVDAPCSGTGTLARNPEIKWRLKAEDLLRLQSYQIGILSAAMQQVKIGGRVIYSTCSLEPEENEEVIEKVLADNSGFQIVDAHGRLRELQASGELVWKDIDSLITGPYLRTIPGVHPCDGFFAVILERT